jgi:hypothetical protein
MTSGTALYLVVDGFGVFLAVRSLFILRTGSPWSSVGWLCTALFFALLFERASTRRHGLGQPFDVGLLIGLALTFGIGTSRDERQAEPWFWPTRLSSTRAERRRSEDER